MIISVVKLLGEKNVCSQKDQSGTLFGQKLDYFHIPTKAEEQFVPRMSPPEGDIGSYPSNTRAAFEYTYDKERGPKDYELWPKV